MKEITKLIYCQKSDVGDTLTRKAFLREFLAGRFPTYDEDGELECPEKKHRSITSLLALVRSRFPNTSLKAVIRILSELNNSGRCCVMYCTQVGKFVVLEASADNQINEPFVSVYSQKYYKNKVGEDGLSFEELMSIRNEVINN